MGQPGVPHLMEWLRDVLPDDSTIGADPKLVPNSVWNEWLSKIGDYNYFLLFPIQSIRINFKHSVFIFEITNI
jgi:hypothetical protein